jgi:hypothetical protein
MYLEGDPFTIGYTSARLTDGIMKGFEDDFVGIIQKRIPSLLLRYLVREYVLVRLRHLPDYIDEEYKLELLGASRGFTDYHPEIAPLYYRLGGYHAAHDIANFIMELPVKSSGGWDGCTAFAAWGRQTADGHLLVGRNFDFSGGPDFDQDKIVTFFKPENGYGFVSVSWPGMMAVVSGMNEKRIYVSINAAVSNDHRRVGTPSSFVARKVLQYASCMEEAVAIIARAKVFVSDSFLVADGNTGMAVVVEKTPDRVSVRRPAGNWIVLANHFMTPELAQDSKNLKYMHHSTTLDRQKRMEDLVSGATGKLNVLIAASFLRDRGESSNAGEGVDPQAINTLIAAHSLIADVTTGILWVSAGPHQEGEYIPFSVKDFKAPVRRPAVPKDLFLRDGRYERYMKTSSQASSNCERRD